MDSTSQFVTRPKEPFHLAQLTFYPIGNADCTLIELNDNRTLLIDYCNENCDDGRIKLDETLKEALKEQGRDYFDVVAFTHADDDHVHGAEEFFYFDYAKKYQSDSRVKIDELWVPACFILDDDPGKAAWVIQQEARHRFCEGDGIRVFGEPETLEAWLTSRGYDIASRRHLIARAGKCLPEFSSTNGGVEIFPHSPFSVRMQEDNSNRNGNSIVLHLTFFEGSHQMRCMLGADAEADTWIDIVVVTTWHKNDERLIWDLFHISHHCSYTGLSNEKGKNETTPSYELKYLFEQGNPGAILISPSQKIPTVDTTQPPHRQAASFYRRVAAEKDGQFIVTMDWPLGAKNPVPLVVETSERGFTVKKDASSISGSFAVTSQQSPRFG